MLKSFDHVTLLVQDMDAAVKRFSRLGFHVFDRGDQGASNMHNRLIRFADGSFIELMGFSRPDVHDAHRFWPLLKVGEGWVDYAICAAQIDQYVGALDRLGLPTSGKKSISKMMRDGEAWKVELIIAGRGQGDPTFPFLVEDLTPRELRVPAAGPAERQPAAATGIVGVSVVTRSLAAVHPAMTAMFGQGTVIATRDDDLAAVMRYGFGDCWIQVIEPAQRDSVYSRHLAKWDGGLFEVFLRSDGSDRGMVTWPAADTCHAKLTVLPASGVVDGEFCHG